MHHIGKQKLESPRFLFPGEECGFVIISSGIL